MTYRRGFLLAVSIAALLIAGSYRDASAQQQKMDSLSRERARGMLHDAYDCVKKNYYDPTFHGLDWDARFREFDERIKNAASLTQGLSIVASFLEGLQDSHTYFRPPARTFKFDYGYRMQLFGDNAFITRIRPGTDAESKVYPGDQVLKLGNFEVNRDDFDTLNYYFNALAPKPSTRLTLRSPSGQIREVEVMTKIQEGRKIMELSAGKSMDLWQLVREQENEEHLVRQRYVESGDVMIWKMPEFFLEDQDVDRLFNIARKHKALVLDLRDNPGGAVTTLQRMVGSVFDHEIKIADRVGRKESKPQIAKSRGEVSFSGRLIVLVNSESASAAELFARVVQLEHRGTVIGDQTSGSVMEAKGFPFSQGADIKIYYAFSVTDADLVMKDGKSLERSGVIPDEVLLPSPQDLAEGKDPVLARGAQLAGMPLGPVQAGKMFPFEWRPF